MGLDPVKGRVQGGTGFGPRVFMRHDWVFDVLSDLLSYATQNGLPQLAAKVSETIDVAQREIAAAGGGPEEPPQSPPPTGRRMH
jgi:hypothetical protein